MPRRPGAAPDRRRCRGPRRPPLDVAARRGFPRAPPLRRLQDLLRDAAPQTLTACLALPAGQAILAKAPLREGGCRQGYRLTPEGHDFSPTLAFLIAWSARWFATEGRPDVTVSHRDCGRDSNRGGRATPATEHWPPRSAPPSSRCFDPHGVRALPPAQPFVGA
uniref:Putative transcriptional regulator n=1 Tax=Streptomyces sp. MJ635-86F5 TaxID=1321967 RepID=X5IID9_9ACTN|nr:putative transcriptional regulator [Streptomyces sp. MJ635-86F5]